ncbi:MAG: glycine dehydrogenase (aminomethyl-transferring) [Candidatus Melainabacteria bacterium RIFCSPLOWO2_12_FULL_35_11]|nr:MAG: glycine dehydrogenase (aminomethyl-transferring) [Candidatus Melainabacteria bacterium RIFCSPLOWO2_12_FULL_35_11]
MRPIPYLPHTNEDRKEMFDFLGIKSMDDLLKSIPEELRSFELNIPDGKSEIEITEEFRKLSNKNVSLAEQISFCGGGVYHRYIPSVVNEIISKGEFYTAYTPYQPEVSQGTLQAIYEFQSLVCNLTGMDAANASVYDGSTAVVEAALMACRITKRKKILVAKSINPEAIQVCKTYSWGLNLELEFMDFENGVIDLEKLKLHIDEETACFVISYPNFAGCIEPVSKIAEIVHSKGALLVSNVDLINLAVLKSPKESGIDIAAGDGQSLGNFSNYGGPHVGFISCLKDSVRQLPGRIVGLTKDIEGKRAFTLTLQTREQHIRREHATSNICTNQSLNALAVLVYLAYMGPQGLKKIAEISLNRAHYLAEKLTKDIKNCKLAFNAPFFSEFVLEIPISASKLIAILSKENILPGLDLNEIDGYKTNQVLVSVTEINNMEQINYFVERLKKLFS